MNGVAEQSEALNSGASGLQGTPTPVKTGTPLTPTGSQGGQHRPTILPPLPLVSPNREPEIASEEDFLSRRTPAWARAEKLARATAQQQNRTSEGHQHANEHRDRVSQSPVSAPAFTDSGTESQTVTSQMDSSVELTWGQSQSPELAAGPPAAIVSETLPNGHLGQPAAPVEVLEHSLTAAQPSAAAGEKRKRMEDQDETGEEERANRTRVPSPHVVPNGGSQSPSTRPMLVPDQPQTPPRPLAPDDDQMDVFVSAPGTATKLAAAPSLPAPVSLQFPTMSAVSSTASTPIARPGHVSPSPPLDILALPLSPAPFIKQEDQALEPGTPGTPVGKPSGNYRPPAFMCNYAVKPNKLCRRGVAAAGERCHWHREQTDPSAGVIVGPGPMTRGEVYELDRELDFLRRENYELRNRAQLAEGQVRAEVNAREKATSAAKDNELENLVKSQQRQAEKALARIRYLEAELTKSRSMESDMEPGTPNEESLALIDSLQQRNAELQNSLNTAINDNAALTAQKSVLEHRISSVNVQVMDASKEADSSKKLAFKLNTMAAQYQKRAQDAEEALKAALQNVATLSKANKDLEANVETMVRFEEKRIQEAVDQRLASTQGGGQVDLAIQRMAGAQIAKLKDDLQRSLDDFTLLLAQYSTEKAQWNTQEKQYQTDLERLKGQTQYAVERFKQSETKSKEGEAATILLNDQIRQLKEQVHQLQKLEKQASDGLKRATLAENRCRQLEAEIIGLNKQNGTMQTKLGNLQEAYQQLSGQYDALRDLYKKVHSEKTAQDARITQLQGFNERLRDAVNNSHPALNNLVAEIRETKEKHEQEMEQSSKRLAELLKQTSLSSSDLARLTSAAAGPSTTSVAAPASTAGSSRSPPITMADSRQLAETAIGSLAFGNSKLSPLATPGQSPQLSALPRPGGQTVTQAQATSRPNTPTVVPKPSGGQTTQRPTAGTVLADLIGRPTPASSSSSAPRPGGQAAPTNKNNGGLSSGSGGFSSGGGTQGQQR